MNKVELIGRFDLDEGGVVMGVFMEVSLEA